MFLDKSKTQSWVRFVAYFVALAFVVTLIPIVGNVFQQNAAQNTAAQQQTDPQQLQISSLESKVKVEPTDHQSWLQLAQLYLGRGEYQKSADAYNKLVTLKKETPDTYYYLGVSYKGLNKGTEAVTSFEKYLALDPEAKDRASVEQMIEEIKASDATSTTTPAAPAGGTEQSTSGAGPVPTTSGSGTTSAGTSSQTGSENN